MECERMTHLVMGVGAVARTRVSSSAAAVHTACPMLQLSNTTAKCKGKVEDVFSVRERQMAGACTGAKLCKQAMLAGLTAS